MALIALLSLAFVIGLGGGLFVFVLMIHDVAQRAGGAIIFSVHSHAPSQAQHERGSHAVSRVEGST